MRRIWVLAVALSFTAAGCAMSRSDSAAPRHAENRKPVPAARGGAAGTGGEPANGNRAGWFPRKGELRQRVARYLADRPARVGLMVLDLTTGRTFDHRPGDRFVAASVMKVNILAGMLLRRQDEGRPLTRSERSLATGMIRASDNSAADEMYEKVGRGPGLSRVNRRFGLRDTVPYPTAWGASETTPADQVRLLRRLTTATGPLNAPNRRFVLHLMGTVRAGQDWGVGAGAKRGETVAVKNGWTPLSRQGHGWAVHSIGRIRGQGHDFLVAVCTTGSPSLGSGIKTTEQLSRLTLSRLREV